MGPQRAAVVDQAKTANGIPRPVDLTPAASGYLDLIRGLAAIAVLFNHWRIFLFANYPEVAPSLSRSILIKAMYFLTGFGPQAVMVFFVLSGLFISSSVLRGVARSWSWREYAIDRGVRLYLVLIPGLVLGGFWDLIGLRYFNGHGVYSAPLLPFQSVEAQFKLSSFFGSLFFLQTRFTTIFGSDCPLWSLFNEFWYYVLFPVLVAFIVSARRRSVSALAYGGLAIAVCWVLGQALPGFIVWLAGGAVALSARYFPFGPLRKRAAWAYTLSTGILATACLIAARMYSTPASNIVAGVAFALFAHAIVQLRTPMSATARRFAKSLASFSYSLYVLHFPLLLLIRAWWLPASKAQPDTPHLLGAAPIAIGIIVYAFLVAQVTERKTAEVRLWLRRRIGLVT